MSAKRRPGKRQPGKTQPGKTQPGKTQPRKTQPRKTQVETRSGKTRSGTAPDLKAGAPLNLCLVRGECSAEPDLRVLASGTRLAVLSVRVRGPGAPTTSIPVAVWDPPARVEALAAGTEVVVVGRVVRRFFRTVGGSAGSRVEVHADLVAPAGDRRTLARVFRRAGQVLDELVEEPA